MTRGSLYPTRAPLFCSAAPCCWQRRQCWHYARRSTPSPGRNQITVYSPQTSYSVPLLDVKGQPYVGLVDLLEPLGSVDAQPDGKKYKLRFTPPGGRPAEAAVQRRQGQSQSSRRKLQAACQFPAAERARLCAPGRSYRICWQNSSGPKPNTTHLARRLFIGNCRYASRWNCTRAILHACWWASLRTGQSLHCDRARARTLHLSPRAVAASGHDSFTYNDPLITGAAFPSTMAIAELDVMGTAPLMANFADGGKTIIVTAAPPPPPPVADAPEPPRCRRRDRRRRRLQPQSAMRPRASWC